MDNDKKKIIIISSIVGAVVVIGLMIWFISGAINKGKEIVEGVGSISNSIEDSIDKIADAEPTTPEPTTPELTTPEETTKPETTKPEIETIDQTSDPFTAVAEGTYIGCLFCTVFQYRGESRIHAP